MIRIVQKESQFKFGIDAVLVSDFAAFKANSKCCDLGTGTGIIPILCSLKTSFSKESSITFDAVEIQEEMCHIAKENVRLNSLEDRINVVNRDLKEICKVLPKNRYNVVVSNPPYMKVNRGNQNAADSKSIARHEIMCSLEDVIKAASELLMSNGKFYLIHRPERTGEIFNCAAKYNLGVRRMRLVMPSVEKAPTMVMFEMEKCAFPELKVEVPLYVYDAEGKRSGDVERIYSQWEWGKD